MSVPLPKNIKRLIRRGLRKLNRLAGITPGGSSRDEGHSLARQSFSQCGEDMLLAFVCEVLKIENPNYLDIGAHHPFKGSNTAYFYLKGSRGVTAEPDPDCFELLKIERPGEVHLNAGISDRSGVGTFYAMRPSTLNTFSRAESDRLVSEGLAKLRYSEEFPLLPINEVIGKYFDGKPLHILSLDAEGADELILKAIDYSKYAPLLICVETIGYDVKGIAEKNQEINCFLEDQGYFLFADTYVNSIFLKKEVWERRSL